MSAKSDFKNGLFWVLGAVAALFIGGIVINKARNYAQ
jgi:hypothetical protein